MYIVGPLNSEDAFFFLAVIWNQGTYICPYKIEIKESYLC